MGRVLLRLESGKQWSDSYTKSRIRGDRQSLADCHQR